MLYINFSLVLTWQVIRLIYVNLCYFYNVLHQLLFSHLSRFYSALQGMATILVICGSIQSSISKQKR